MERIGASSGRERIYIERREKVSERIEISYRDGLLIDRGRGGWGEGIKNYIHVRGKQVSERLRGE